MKGKSKYDAKKRLAGSTHPGKVLQMRSTPSKTNLSSSCKKI
jgi:hypothetical protein